MRISDWSSDVCSSDLQSAQLRGGAEIQLGAFVDVERPVEVIGLQAQVVAVSAALVEQETVDHLLRRAAVEQAGCIEAHGGDRSGVRPALQRRRHALLHTAVEGRLDREIEAIEVVERAKARSEEHTSERKSVV